MTRSPLRWAGSKRGLLPAIRPLLPTRDTTYIEPFMGSACVFFDLLPTRARLSDFNSELIHFYTELRDRPRELVSRFRSFDVDGSEYYEWRAATPDLLDASDRAARFLYLNRFAFNGVYRTNRRGEFNVPRGVRTGALPSDDELLAASNALQSVTIHRPDYLESTSEADRGDFVYLDPPYRNTARSTYGEYGYESFGSAADVSALASELTRLDQLGARVLLSFNDDDEITKAIPEWTVIRINRKRSVAGAASARTALAGEILAFNFERSEVA